MRLAESAPLRIRFQRGVGSRALRSCPEPGAGPPFSGRFETVKTRKAPVPGATAAVAVAAIERRVRLNVRLKPGLYRVTVRAVLGDGSVSAPHRVFLRVLKR